MIKYLSAYAATAIVMVAFDLLWLGVIAKPKNWPISVSLLDMAWGTLLRVVSAAAGKAMLDRFAVD